MLYTQPNRVPVETIMAQTKTSWNIIFLGTSVPYFWLLIVSVLIDICVLHLGAGSSCIYPLLGAKLNGWNFLGTEVDDTSISFARKNIKINGFEEKIKG